MKIDAKTAEDLREWFPGLDFSSVMLVQGGPASWFVANVLRQGAMTFPPFIIYGKSRLDVTKAASLALLAHELNHVLQYRQRGRAGFLARYWLDMARNGFRYSQELPLEAPCYALQREVRQSLEQRGFA